LIYPWKRSPEGGSYLETDPGETNSRAPRISIAPDEEPILARLFRDSFAVLEIGTGLGISTLAILSELPLAGRIVSIDPDPWVHATIWPALSLHRRIETRASLLPEDAGAFDGCFIDADHQAEAVALDTASALNSVRPGGIIVLHDWNSEAVRMGCRRAFAGAPDSMNTTYGLGIFRRPPA